MVTDWNERGHSFNIRALDKLEQVEVFRPRGKKRVARPFNV